MKGLLEFIEVMMQLIGVVFLWFFLLLTFPIWIVPFLIYLAIKYAR